jgi:hypothetical protein
VSPEQQNNANVVGEFKIDRRAFGDFIEQEKAIEGRGASSEYGYQDLRVLAQKYIADGGR